MSIILAIAIRTLPYPVAMLPDEDFVGLFEGLALIPVAMVLLVGLVVVLPAALAFALRHRHAKNIDLDP